MKILFFGDSWFGSVKAVVKVEQASRHTYMLIDKANMKDFPGGTWITLEATRVKKNAPLICIGHKYNKKKVLTFVMTKGAEKTTDGEPYKARISDKYGNVYTRNVQIPEIISEFFK